MLDAQSYLAGWYRKRGFEDDGEEFVEYGIAHLPMRRESSASVEADHSRRVDSQPHA